MQRLYPMVDQRFESVSLDPLSIYDDVVWGEPDRSPLERPYTAVNMVTTVDGKTTLDAHRVREPIGSEVDRGLMVRLRAAADAVIRGAETVRRVPYYPRTAPDLAARRRERGLPEAPLAVVVSASCDLPWESPYFKDVPRRPVVLTVDAAPRERVAAARTVAHVEVVGEREVDVLAALRLLWERYGVRRLLSEGGSRLNFEFFRAGALDELFWTIAPKVSGFAGDLTMVAGPAVLNPLPRMQLLSAYFHDGELFLRYRVRQHHSPA